MNQASEILPELLGSPTITRVSGENNFCLNAWRDRSVEEWKGLGRATKELRGTRGGSKVLVETVESWRSIAAYEERNLWQFGETLCDLFREIVLCALHLPDTVGYYWQEGTCVHLFHHRLRPVSNRQNHAYVSLFQLKSNEKTVDNCDLTSFIEFILRDS